MKPIEIHKKFRPLWEEKTRYYLITGGRNSGKSFAANIYIADKTWQQGNKILSTRFTMSSAELSVIPEFEEKIELCYPGESQKFNINRSDITNLKTGSKVIFRGLKTGSLSQTASLKSLQAINVWLLDEAEELLDENVFEKVDLSIRSKTSKNIIILILNPTTKEHWIWKRWFDGHLSYTKIEGFDIPISTHPDITHIHTTYRDNINNIPKDYLRVIEAIRENDPDKYRHKILGGWLEKAEGVIYENWEEGVFNYSLPSGYGLDFGYSIDPDALVKVAIDKKRKLIYLKEEMYANGQSSDVLERKLKSTCGRDEIIGDCAEPRLIDDLRRKGVNLYRSVKGPDSVRAGIKIMQSYRMVVEGENLKRELNNYAWSDKKSETPIDKYNHLLDAARYYVFKKLKGEPDLLW